MTVLKLLLNTDKEPKSTFQIPSLQTVHSALQRRYIDDVMFSLHEDLIISETVYDRRKLTVEH